MGVVRASCLCGGIEVEVDQNLILFMNNCHCSSCRKVSGAAYATFVQVKGSGFRWISGAELVSTFESSPGNHRAFCKVCGTRAPQSQDFKEHATVPGGMFDDTLARQPEVNMFVGEKANWHTIRDGIPQCEGRGSPEFWREVLSGSPGR
jgi:hypothetical protein